MNHRTVAEYCSSDAARLSTLGMAPAPRLLGTVIGYYLGRVPAERHADSARDAATAAQGRELTVRQQVHTGLADIQEKHDSTKRGMGCDAIDDAINLLRSNLQQSESAPSLFKEACFVLPRRKVASALDTAVST